MSWTPTDEQVETAARVRFHQAQGEGEAWEEWGTSWHHLYRTEARAMLVAVGPTIAAAAFDEGWIARSNREPVHRLNDGIAPPRSLNPYRQEAGRG